VTRSRRRSRLIRLAVVLAAIVSIWYAVAWVRRTPAPEGLAAIAHRGAPRSGRAAENTLPAFEAAIGAGADWLEFDVRRTADGELVVIHDPTLEQTHGRPDAVADLTLDEIRAFGPPVVPTAAEVVSLAVASQVGIAAEIKDGPANDGLAAQLIELIRASDAVDRTVLLAFEPATLEELVTIAPEIRRCWLTSLAFDLTSPPGAASHVCPMGEAVLLAPDVIRQAHDAGLTVWVWWLAAESRAAAAIVAGFGADGLIVDDLGRLP
jgi:glycerophosphoryl diester phosphodiesterase